MQLAILTASRTNEVLGAKRPEFDLVAGLWTIPAGRMKVLADASAGRVNREPINKNGTESVAGKLHGMFSGNRSRETARVTQWVPSARVAIVL